MWVQAFTAFKARHLYFQRPPGDHKIQPNLRTTEPWDEAGDKEKEPRPGAGRRKNSLY